MPQLHRLARTRLARGTAVGFYGLGVQLVVQLVSVPILTRHWGVAGYGIWVLLFTVPALLAMADLGLTTTGANAMIDAIARGEKGRAARIHGALRAITVATGGALLLLAAFLLFVVRPHSLEFAATFEMGEVRDAAMLLCLYGFLGLINGVTLAAFRAADSFALSGAIFHTIGLVEAIAALSVVLTGGRIGDVALAYLLARLVGTVTLSASLRGLAPWVRKTGWRVDLTELRDLIRPALAALLYPAANAIALQGSVMAIGALGGPAAVPAYTVVRTLSRTALQFAMRFNIAAMPRYTVFIAQDDKPRASQLVTLNLVVTLALIVPAALAMLAFGLPFIALWTGGRIEPSFALLALLVAAMVGEAAWAPLSNLLLAVNRHARFALFYLITSVAGVAFGALLTARWQAEGMATGMAALALAMLGFVWHQALRQGLIDMTGLRSGIAALWHELRRSRASSEDLQP